MTVEIKGLGKITASKDVLNVLSIYFDEASETYDRKGYEHSAKQTREQSQEIYDALKESGYYNN